MIQAANQLFVVIDERDHMSWRVYKQKEMRATAVSDWQMMLQDSGTFTIADKPSSSVNLPRKQSSLCYAHNKHIYMLGGQISMKNITSCARFDLKGNRAWQEMPSLNQARSRHSSCTLGDCIYIIGGLSALNADQKQIERLNLAQVGSKWQELDVNFS